MRYDWTALLRPLRIPGTALLIVLGVLGLAPSARSADDGACARCEQQGRAGEADGWIAVFPAAQEPAIRDHGIPVWGRNGDHVVAGVETSDLEALALDRIEPMLKVRDRGQWINFLIHDEGYTPPVAAQAEVYALSATDQLWLVPPDMDFEFPRVKPRGGFMAVARVPLAPISLHPADEASARALVPESVNPLVTEIVDATSQANWFQDVKDMSGENPVMIGGNSFTISTRYTRSMFPTPAGNAMATEFILDKAGNWGYTGVRESYTSAESGCGQNPPIWQNVVFTLPGQVDFGQHQQVIFVTHYDSLSNNPTVYAPGADDAISGGSALFEALRLFRSYGFANTVKIIFFSGEEQGLCGSVAYTHQHPAADMYRVVNMDQTAYDGNQNLLMDCYNWSLASSPQSVALGDAFVQANADYGTIINPPSNIQRPTNMMCQTDHCPFWNVGVAAIAITEDLAHGDISPCFDGTDTASCHDTVTQVDPNHSPRLIFNPDFSWPSEKAAIATVAHIANPLYACPASAPTPTPTVSTHTVNLSWDPAPGVTNYVVERAPSCAGPFTGLTSATGTSYQDTGLTNGTTYAYRIRTCPTQVSSCVTAVPNGPSVVYQPSSAQVIADTGDHDPFADNCETVTARLTIQNDGNQMLTNVRLANVTSSDPAVQVVSALPQIVGTLGVGGSAQVGFKFYLGRNGNSEPCAAAIPFTVTLTSDQAPMTIQNFTLDGEKSQDPVTVNYTFETNLSGWTVTTGSFTRVAGGAPGSTAFSLHSRNINNDCDAVASPIVTPTGSSTMTMWVNYGIQGSGGASNTFDRAVVRAINTTNGTKTLLVPTVTPYTTTGCGAPSLCDGLCNLQGYAGSHTSWTQADFDLSAFAGIPIQIEVRYATDAGALGTQGFWFDNVSITNTAQISCDAQSNTCSPLPAEVSPIADPVQFTIVPNGTDYDLRFSEVAGATAYHVYGGSLPSLHAGGVYDHASLAGLCGFTDGTPGDGQVQATVSAASIPASAGAGKYLLAVASNGAGESPYGSRSNGAPIPIAYTSCP